MSPTDPRIDRATKEREGEALDRTRLLAYLRGCLDLPKNLPLEVAQFRGGHSNLTYLLRIGERELVLRRPPFGTKVKSAHDMGREHRILAGLAPHLDLVPKPLLYCEDLEVLGAPFYVMERLRGLILRRTLPPGVTIDQATAEKLSQTFVDTLSRLHAVDLQACGLASLGRPQGYVDRQVQGWTRRYANAKTDEIPAIDRVASWLQTNIPNSPAPTLLHNDFKYDNLVLDPDDLTQVRGVLDWEMATQGDPLMDLGTALCYWIEADDPAELQAFAFGPTAIPGSLSRRDLAQAYGRKTGRDLDDIVFYYCFGLFKTAVVAQQIYARYASGLTQDQRFAAFIIAVRGLAEQAARYCGRRDL
ncbi:MAG TPA: phosphotransferase family protein [Nannocystis exedens]|nr:phosphotransferase family protein [Nannocystis exedens]